MPNDKFSVSGNMYIPCFLHKLILFDLNFNLVSTLFDAPHTLTFYPLLLMEGVIKRMGVLLFWRFGVLC